MNTTEIILTTKDGICHLKLHGWLKRESFTIKAEQILSQASTDFGMFILDIQPGDVERLRECSDLWDSIEYLGGDDGKWDTYKQLKQGDFIKDIKDFMFSPPFNHENMNINPQDNIPIDELIAHTNETSLKLFRKNPEFIDNYLSTEELTEEEKQIDLLQMIGYFEKLERYEDCAFLVKIKNKLK